MHNLNKQTTRFLKDIFSSLHQYIISIHEYQYLPNVWYIWLYIIIEKNLKKNTHTFAILLSNTLITFYQRISCGQPKQKTRLFMYWKFVLKSFVVVFHKTTDLYCSRYLCMCIVERENVESTAVGGVSHNNYILIARVFIYK